MNLWDNDTTGTNCVVIDGVISLEDYIIINFPEVIVNAKLEVIGSSQENFRNAWKMISSTGATAAPFLFSKKAS